MGTVVSREDLVKVLRWRRAFNFVLCNGVYDLVHIGHVRMLQRAAGLGDQLIVAVNSDASVRTLGKGDDRPFVPEADRAEMLAALLWVDWVTIFDEPTPIEVIKLVRPMVLCKGSDWANKEIVGREEVESWGGRVEIIPLEPGYSTTALVERIRAGRK
jgi:D-beta-D-heptose 7-phosphate kinase/D-beta-D-heptose 1-phosphate adenosyltransferase